NSSECFFDLLYRPEHARAISHVAIERQRLAACLVDFMREFFELHAPACEQRNLRPLFAKRKGDVMADSTRRPRYDHRLVEEVSAHRSFGFPLGFAHNRHLDMGAAAWN